VILLVLPHWNTSSCYAAVLPSLVYTLLQEFDKRVTDCINEYNSCSSSAPLATTR
jgi:hypothetical protein